VKRDAFTLNLLPDELVIDNFAGGGGASTGIERGIGRPVNVAINHDPEALAMHAANHPHTAHYCESVWDIDPREVTRNAPVGLVWLSPDCKHFSKAKGGKPVEKKIRGLAWVALRWAAVARPRVIMLENVEEFTTWGPLGPDGRPCPQRKGEEFGKFVRALNRQGYAVEWRELRACDFGAPTIRKRLFLIARRDGLPIAWPEPTHGNPTSRAVIEGKLLPWRTAAECIDWSIPCPSIFERTRPLAEATLRRIAKGIMRYVVDAAEPFIVNTRNGERKGQAPRVRGINEPAWTITAQGSQHALVVPVLTEHANASSPRCMPADEPLRTICAQTKGGHHALVTALLAKHYTGVVGSDLRDCIGTVTSVDHHSLVTGLLEPVNGRNGRTETASIGRTVGGQAGWDDLENCQTRQPAAGNSDSPQACRESEQERLSDGEDGVEREVLSAVSSHRSLQVARRADLEWNGHQSPGRQQEKQSSGEHGAGNARGEPRACAQDRAEECVGVNSKGLGHAEEVKAFLVAYYGNEQDGVELGEPMRTVTARDRFGLVTIAGQDYAIADIGLRMLAPRELFKAQGFPDNYIIGDAPYQGLSLTKSAQVRMCGNSVCPPLSEAIVRANFRHEAAWRVQA
jgi:DNA (cytosine-5)-methyltransferase 1